MIHCLFPKHMTDEGEIVAKAIERSFTQGQVRTWFGDKPTSGSGDVFVAVSPSDDDLSYFASLVERRTKIILLGAIGPALAALAGVSISPVKAAWDADAICPPAPVQGISESAAVIRYSDAGLGQTSPLRSRRLCRFDFADEWNNLGYGRIGLGKDMWSIGVVASPTAATIVAKLTGSEGKLLGAVATVRDFATSSVLWFGRPVGPVDGADWSVIESFISHYRTDLPCRPSLRDIPHGVGAAVTMRLDCDEDIASSRPLFDLYRKRGFPLSLAIKTDQPENDAHVAMLHDIRSAGGSILSHSVTHAPSWGGSAEAAEAEARGSKQWLDGHVVGLSVRYAVSPFHQNPRYVPDALASAGYSGFVGGIIANDPEYLVARGGIAPFGPRGFVTHSQSCMLHGDCMLSDGAPLRIYKEAFSNAMSGSQFFGYLDHPFSSRYAYGWTSEADRLAKHADFLDAIEAECDGTGLELLFVNEEKCLDFMQAKSVTTIEFDEANNTFSISRTHAAGLPLSVAFRGQNQAAADV